MFLGDLLQRGDLRQLLDRDGTLGDSAKAGVLRAGAMLRDVQAMLGHPLAEVIRAAVRALDLDIDTVVAQAIRDGEQAANPTVARMPLNTLVDLTRHLYPGTGGRADADAARFPLLGDVLGNIEDEAASMP